MPISFICREEIKDEPVFPITSLYGTKEQILDRFYDLLAETIKQLTPETIEFLAEKFSKYTTFFKGQFKNCQLSREFIQQIADKKIRPTGVLMHVVRGIFTNVVSRTLGEPQFNEKIAEKSRAYWERQFSNALKHNGPNPENTGPQISLEGILWIHAISQLDDWLDEE